MGVILRMVAFMFVSTSVISLSDNMSAFQRKIVWNLPTVKCNTGGRLRLQHRETESLNQQTSYRFSGQMFMLTAFFKVFKSV